MKKVHYFTLERTYYNRISIPIINTIRLYFYLHFGILEKGTLHRVGGQISILKDK